MTRRLLALGVVLAVVWPVASGSAEPSASPAEPAAAGTLSVSSNPEVAAVYVDGRFVGQTPVNVPGLPAGDRRVRLVKDGFLENSRVVRVETSKPKSLAVRLTARAQNSAAPSTGLHIVVIAGEGAVNILMRNTAVAPIVEVQDRNNLPVAGATVTFTIGGGNTAAFAGGAQTLSVTTSAAGRAVTTALNPIAAGRVQIRVQAAFNGQTADTTISQVNVLTAAAAATAGAAAAGAAAGGAAGAGAAGGAATAAGTAAGASAGLSGAAIGGIVAGAAAGGTLVAVKAANSGGGSDAKTGTTFTGPFTAQLVVRTTDVSNGGKNISICDSTRSMTGTMTILLIQQSDGTVTGMGNLAGTAAETNVTASPTCQASFGTVPISHSAPVTGTPASFTFGDQSTSTSSSPAVTTVTSTFTFAGSLSNSVIAGTATFSEVSTGHELPPSTA